MLAAFDLTRADRDDLIAVLKAWTTLGAELVAGQNVTVPIYTRAPAAEPVSDRDATPNRYANTTAASAIDDSFEAYGLGPERLTLTIGLGATLSTTPAWVDRSASPTSVRPRSSSCRSSPATN